MKTMRNFWAKDYAPHLLALIIIIGLYFLAADTKLIEFLMGGM